MLFGGIIIESRVGKTNRGIVTDLYGLPINPRGSRACPRDFMDGSFVNLLTVVVIDKKYKLKKVGHQFGTGQADERSPVSSLS